MCLFYTTVDNYVDNLAQIVDNFVALQHHNWSDQLMRMIINTDQYRGRGMELCCNIAVATLPLKK